MTSTICKKQGKRQPFKMHELTTGIIQIVRYLQHKILIQNPTRYLPINNAADEDKLRPEASESAALFVYSTLFCIFLF